MSPSQVPNNSPPPSPPFHTKSFVIFEVEEWNTLSYSLRCVILWFLWVVWGNGQIPQDLFMVRVDIDLEMIISPWITCFILGYNVCNMISSIPLIKSQLEISCFFKVNFNVPNLLRVPLFFNGNEISHVVASWKTLPQDSQYFLGQLVDIFKLIKWHQNYYVLYIQHLKLWSHLELCQWLLKVKRLQITLYHFNCSKLCNLWFVLFNLFTYTQDGCKNGCHASTTI